MQIPIIFISYNISYNENKADSHYLMSFLSLDLLDLVTEAPKYAGIFLNGNPNKLQHLDYRDLINSII